MCLVISIALLALAYNLFMANNLLLAFASVAAALFFIVLMVKNIQSTKKRKDLEKQNDN